MEATNKALSSQRTPKSGSWLIERLIIGCIFLLALFAPHSIAVTQSAWLLGMVLWAATFVFFPRPKLFRTPVDYVLLGFFILSGISGIFSYSPVISIGKMRAASLFTIAYLVAENVRSLRLVRLLAFALVASCFVTVLLTAYQFSFGKGVKVQGVTPGSPLTLAVFHTRTVTQPTPISNGDIIWEVDHHAVNNPDELAAALSASVNTPFAEVKIYRVEWTPSLEVPRGRLLPGDTPEKQLGITGWTRGRDWRATGFYGHWVTYAEVLQLIASLALGLFLAVPRKLSRAGLLLGVGIVGLVFSLSLTVTRASWVGFALSGALMLLFSVSRRTLLIAGLVAIPVILGGVLLLQQKRNIGFFDSKDQSTSWRQTVWKEGFQLLVSSPRHLLVGVGMDSIKGHWREWGLFDRGRLPVGHMHSNLLQIALERGVPALLLWLAFLFVYARMLLQTLVMTRREIHDSTTHDLAWVDHGIVLGALGGTLGFFSSGLVHYNWGDSEVVMVFYFVLGLSLVIARKKLLMKG